VLWYKAWLETRSRFLISLFGIAALCSYNVFHEDRLLPLDYPRLAYYYRVLHGGHLILAPMWVLAVTLLMMGGLVREKAIGVSSFTLALPVSRTRLMSVRISVGLIQAMALAILPWSAMFLVANLTGRAHSIAQAGFHLVLLAGGGLVFFALALLISSLVEGEYTAPMVSYGILIALAVAIGRGFLRPYSPWEFIMGEEYIDIHTFLLVGPIPWLHLAVSILLAALLTAISVKAIQRREF
jgi:ABC-type transport system involved in multi-copper enzyme maturation permease subunit